MPPFPADTSAFWDLGEAAKREMDGRVLEAMPVWDGEQWTIWLPIGGGGLRPMHPTAALQTDYLARMAAHANDVSFPFLEFLWQRASWPDVIQVLKRLRRDVRNFATCLAKFDHYYSTRSVLGSGASTFVETEIEYLFTLSRSIFDLLQEVIVCIGANVELCDPLAGGRKVVLPKFFRKVVLKDDAAVPAADIQSRFQLRPGLAESYASIAQFFAQVRRFRDDVVHRGTSVELVFVTERGFCVDLVPVAPAISFDKTDSRFIEGKEVLHRVAGLNLTAMDWQDFEHLIRELFEKEFSAPGAEVRITQASRDRGVDAVIFDPDPLRGGKTIIQAKRYTNTVDVSAVRDLYGTVMNEGANRGILVTTSDFGPDAHAFEQGKPLALVSGSKLLHLLSKHGYHARIDLKQAKEMLANVDGAAKTPS